MINLIFFNEYSYFILLMVLTALPVGFFAGLFGIGGWLNNQYLFYFLFF